MREILFRGKTAEPSDKRKWIYGAVIFPKEGLSACITNGNIATCRLDDIAYFVHTQVLLETVGQFTGLTDKNGTKIFEGDIVKGVAYSTDFVGTIVWIDEIAGFGIRYFNKHREPTAWENSSILKAIQRFKMPNEFQAEVIGNIHDNPELLK